MKNPAQWQGLLLFYRVTNAKTNNPSLTLCSNEGQTGLLFYFISIIAPLFGDKFIL